MFFLLPQHSTYQSTSTRMDKRKAFQTSDMITVTSPRQMDTSHYMTTQTRTYLRRHSNRTDDIQVTERYWKYWVILCAFFLPGTVMDLRSAENSPYRRTMQWKAYVTQYPRIGLRHCIKGTLRHGTVWSVCRHSTVGSVCLLHVA